MTVSFNLRTLFTHFLCAFVVIGTFFFIPASNMSALEAIYWGYQSQELFFRFGVLSVFGASLFLKELRRSDMKIIGLLACLVISCGLNFGFDILIRRAILNIFLGFLFIKTVADHFEFKHLKIVSYWFIGLLLFNFVMCLQQYYKFDPLFTVPTNLGPKDAMTGFMRMKVHLGALLSIISPIIFYTVPWLLVISIPMLCVSNSSAAIASFAVSIGMLIFFKIKRIYAVIALVLIISGGVFYVLKFDLPGGQFSKRFKVWNVVYGETLKRNMFFGSGAGSFAKLNLKTIQQNGQPEGWSWAHNEYIQAFYEFGAIGIGIIASYLIFCFKEFRRNFKDYQTQIIFSSLLSILGISFLHFPFHIARLAIPSLFIMGLFHGKLEDLKNAS